jgi:His-Xaa-Ser system protein HxsD
MHSNPVFDTDCEGVTLKLDTSIFSLEAIKKTAYKFAGQTSVTITPASASSVSVFFDFSGRYEKNDRRQIVADFCNELLDQDLREIIKKDTGPLRNLIIAHAFSRTSLAKES